MRCSDFLRHRQYAGEPVSVVPLLCLASDVLVAPASLVDYFPIQHGEGPYWFLEEVVASKRDLVGDICSMRFSSGGVLHGRDQHRVPRHDCLCLCTLQLVGFVPHYLVRRIRVGSRASMVLPQVQAQGVHGASLRAGCPARRRALGRQVRSAGRV